MGFHVSNAVIEQVVVPIAQGLWAGGMTYAVVTQFDARLAAPIALAAWGGWTLHAFDRRTPKKYQPASFTRAVNRAEPAAAAYNATIQAPPIEMSLTVKGEGSTIVNGYRLPGVQYWTTAQIAFHLVYLQGRLSDNYMVEKWKILKRNEDAPLGWGLRFYQGLYVECEWMQWKGAPYGRAGMEPTETGRSVFTALAREHTPTPDERKQLKTVVRGGTSRTHAPRTHVISAYPIGPEGGVGDGD